MRQQAEAFRRPVSASVERATRPSFSSQNSPLGTACATHERTGVSSSSLVFLVHRPRLAAGLIERTGSSDVAAGSPLVFCTRHDLRYAAPNERGGGPPQPQLDVGGGPETPASRTQSGDTANPGRRRKCGELDREAGFSISVRSPHPFERKMRHVSGCAQTGQGQAGLDRHGAVESTGRPIRKYMGARLYVILVRAGSHKPDVLPSRYFLRDLQLPSSSALPSAIFRLGHHSAPRPGRTHFQSDGIHCDPEIWQTLGYRGVLSAPPTQPFSRQSSKRDTTSFLRSRDA
jgi:hypothetical protein